MREKTVQYRDPVAIEYDDAQWSLFTSLRTSALEIIARLPQPAMVYGSLCRGDIHSDSDIDIVILDPVPTYLVEHALERGGYQPIEREIVQACPNSVPKGHIHIDERTTVTVPLLPLKVAEEAFYRFGGILDHDQLDRDERVAGVNKRLLLIQPTASGHIESSVINREVEVARSLGVMLSIVEERVRVLSRRDAIGRTGVFLTESLAAAESFEERFRYLRDRNSALRRQWHQRQ